MCVFVVLSETEFPKKGIEWQVSFRYFFNNIFLRSFEPQDSQEEFISLHLIKVYCNIILEFHFTEYIFKTRTKPPYNSYLVLNISSPSW